MAFGNVVSYTDQTMNMAVGHPRHLTVLLVLLIVLCMMGIHGCTHQKILKEMGADFPGISKRISPGRPLQILMVHGFPVRDSVYAEPLLQKLIASLGVRSQGCRPELNPIRHPDYPGLDYGTVSRCRLSGPQGQQIQLYVLAWAELTSPLKEQALGYDWRDRSLVEDRLPLNHAMKEQLIDRSLSDAVLYAGPFRVQMQYAVQQAMCLMMREHRIQDNVCTLAEAFLGETNFEQIVVVAQGLGGTMVFQTIEALHRQTHELTDPRLKSQFARAADRFAADTASVFLLADQGPLLNLVDQRALLPSRSHSSLEKFIRLRYEQRRKNYIPEAVQIVAFYDPNDILGYPIPESIFDELPEELRSQVLLSTVILTVSDGWVFGSVADPIKAHNGYAPSPTVLRFITCGSRTQASC
jgi:hypothetical protein